MVKIFGAAFDPLDIPEHVDVKIAYLNWLKTHAISKNNFLDPYDIIENNLKKDILQSMELNGSVNSRSTLG